MIGGGEGLEEGRGWLLAEITTLTPLHSSDRKYARYISVKSQLKYSMTVNLYSFDSLYSAHGVCICGGEGGLAPIPSATQLPYQSLNLLPFRPRIKLTLGLKLMSRRRWHMKLTSSIFSTTPTSASCCAAGKTK